MVNNKQKIQKKINDFLIYANNMTLTSHERSTYQDEFKALNDSLAELNQAFNNQDGNVVTKINADLNLLALTIAIKFMQNSTQNNQLIQLAENLRQLSENINKSI